MQPLQFYKYATGFLLLLNISVMLFVWINKPKHPMHLHHKDDGLRQRIVDLLDLDKQQQSIFKEAADIHNQQLLAIDSAQQALLLPYFNSLTDTTDVNSDSSLYQVQVLERQKIELTYSHFKEIKDLLKPEQYDNYKEFIDILLNRLLIRKNGMGKNPRPPKG